MGCRHTASSLREKKDSLGRSLFAEQCDDCFARVGDWVSHRDARTWNAGPWLGETEPHEFGQPPEGLRPVVERMKLVAEEATAHERLAGIVRGFLAGRAGVGDLEDALRELDRAVARRAA